MGTPKGLSTGVHYRGSNCIESYLNEALKYGVNPQGSLILIPQTQKIDFSSFLSLFPLILRITRFSPIFSNLGASLQVKTSMKSIKRSWFWESSVKGRSHPLEVTKISKKNHLHKAQFQWTHTFFDYDKTNLFHIVKRQYRIDFRTFLGITFLKNCTRRKKYRNFWGFQSF